MKQETILNKSRFNITDNKWLLFILILSVLAFLPTFNNGFTNWDDIDQVTGNPDITRLSLHNLKFIFSSFYVGMYQPFSTFCFAVINSLFGIKAPAFHSFSLLLHLINIVLVFCMMKKLTNIKEIILGITFLFALTPLQTEAVAWVSATSTLLFSLFYLLSANFYLHFIKDKNRKGKYFLSLTFFVFSLLSKSAAMTLPLILLLFDYFLNSKISRKDLVTKIPFFILSIIFGVITIIARQKSGHIVDITKYYNFFDRIIFILYSLSFYVISVFLPFKMSAFHPYPVKTGNILPIFFYIIPFLLIAIIYFLIKIKKNKKEILFGFLFFLLTIIVMIELIPVGTQVVKERYVYISCIGIYFSFFTFIHPFFEKNKKIFLPGIIVISIVFGALTFIRTGTWKNSFSLWNDVIKKYPKCSAAYINRGNAYVLSNNYEQAINDFDNAIKFEPNAADAYTNRAVAKSKSGKIEEAIMDYDKAIAISPSDDKMYSERALLKLGIMDLTGALEDLNKAIEKSSNNEKYFNQRGILYGMAGKFDAAVSDFSKAISLNPEFADAYSNRGYAKINLNKVSEAINDFDLSILKNPDEARTYYLRGMAYAQIEKKNEACADFQKAYDLGMTDASAAMEKVCK